MRIFFLLFLFLPTFALSDYKQISDSKEINKVLASIPYLGHELLGTDMPYKTVADRLPYLGLQISFMSIANLEKEDYENTGGAYQKGDVLYTFNSNQPNDVLKAICPISNSFSFIKRGSKWFPDDRSAAFISTYICRAPVRAK